MAVSMQLDTQRMSVSEGISHFRIKEFLCVAWCWARFGMVELASSHFGMVKDSISVQCLGLNSVSVQCVKISELTHGAAAWFGGGRHEHTSCLSSLAT